MHPLQRVHFSYKQNTPVIVDRSTGVIAAAYCTVERHDCGDCTVNLLCGFFFIGLDVARRITANEDVVHHPPQHGVTAMCHTLLQHELHQFLGRRGHVLESLTEGNDCEAHAFEILHHLHSASAVKGNLPDIEAFAQPLDELLDVAVMDDIALCSLEKSLALPDIVRASPEPLVMTSNSFLFGCVCSSSNTTPWMLKPCLE
nr:MAG TPA: hypothetical protein [Caudoviricetes sp.]